AGELQETFVKLSEGRQTNWLEGLFASHPPSQERVAANRAFAQAHPGGVRNKAAFDKAMAQVRKDQAAYANYTKALEAASQKNYTNALSLVENSIKQQPKENLFWELKGQLLLQQKKEKEAIAALDKAVQANPEFFRPYVYRGLAHKQLGNTAQAEKDLIASHQRLPTQLAAYYLGEIALGKGQRSAAATYFEQAAQGGGEIGEAAKAQLAKMQSPYVIVSGDSIACNSRSQNEYLSGVFRWASIRDPSTAAVNEIPKIIFDPVYISISGKFRTELFEYLIRIV